MAVADQPALDEAGQGQAGELPAAAAPAVGADNGQTGPRQQSSESPQTVAKLGDPSPPRTPSQTAASPTSRAAGEPSPSPARPLTAGRAESSEPPSAESVARVNLCVDAGKFDGRTAVAAARHGVAFEQLLQKGAWDFEHLPAPPKLRAAHAQLRVDAHERRRRVAHALVARELDLMDAAMPGADGDGDDDDDDALGATAGSAKETPADQSGLVQLAKQRAAKAAAAKQRYQQQMDETRRKQEEAYQARVSAQEAEARRLAAKAAASEVEQAKRLEKSVQRELARQAEAERRDARLAKEAAIAAAAIEANLERHAQTAEERRRAEVMAVGRKGKVIDSRISKSKEYRHAAMHARWAQGAKVQRSYDDKLLRHEASVQRIVEVCARSARARRHALCAHASLAARSLLAGRSLARASLAQVMVEKRQGRSGRVAAGGEDVNAETERKLETLMSRLATADARARAQRAERARLASDAAAGKSDFEQTRLAKLVAADDIFEVKLDKMLSSQDAAERRLQRQEAALAHELADARLRAELRAEEVQTRMAMQLRKDEFEQAEAIKRIEAEDAKRAAQLLATTRLAEQRRKADQDERVRAAPKAELPSPGPGAYETSAFFSVGKPSRATTGGVVRKNGPAFSIGIRKEVLAIAPSDTPAPNTYLPRYNTKRAPPKFSMARRFEVPKGDNPAETPGPTEVCARRPPQRSPAPSAFSTQSARRPSRCALI
jgi:hypothetical protein